MKIGVTSLVVVVGNAGSEEDCWCSGTWSL